MATSTVAGALRNVKRSLRWLAFFYFILFLCRFYFGRGESKYPPRGIGLSYLYRLVSVLEAPVM